MDNITAISTLDGRYHKLTESLTDIFSEYGLIKHRVLVELEWLKFILSDCNFDKINSQESELINNIYQDFTIDNAKEIKNIEKVTNHDVKAVEYYIKNKLEDSNLIRIKEWVHFACTSDVINNIAYA